MNTAQHLASTARHILPGLLLSLLLSITPLAARAGDDLYQALGERNGIARVIDYLLVHVVDDPRIGRHFSDSNLERLHRALTDQICQLSGGPCVYQGDSMQDVHAGMQLTSADFNALVEHLVLAMEARGITTGAQNRLLKILAALRPQVIEH